MIRISVAKAGFLVLCVLGAMCDERAEARDHFANNRLGSDSNDGTSAAPQGNGVGPTRTIQKALLRARRGDTVRVVNTGTPYYETVSLNGARHSGWPGGRFCLVSDGAIVSGARRVPPSAWVHMGDDVWRFTPDGKGTFLLLHQGQPLPEVPLDEMTDVPATMAPGTWGSLRGSILYRAPVGYRTSPVDLPLEYAHDRTGLTLVDVTNVDVEGLTFRHFRLDGACAHDRATDVVLSNVKLVENGRAGLAASGTSVVGLRGGELRGNRRASVWIEERGWVELLDTTLENGPSARDFVRDVKTTLFQNGVVVPFEEPGDSALPGLPSDR
jgi:hypothetical protein